MHDICAMGDILVDFTPMPCSPQGNDVYECNAGGTVANLAVGASRLGKRVLFVGRVGDDHLGKILCSELTRGGVDVAGLSFDSQAPSTMSFVMLQNGERSFWFVRRGAADIALLPAHVPMERVLESRLLHISGMCLTDEPVRQTTLETVRRAREKGIIITMDANYRALLWPSEKDFTAQMRRILPMLDIYKSSEEEAFLVTGEQDPIRCSEWLSAQGPKLVVISGGPKGAFYRLGKYTGMLNTYDTRPVDTTGAGDCFMSALLCKVLDRGGLSGLQQEEVEKMLDFANAAGAVSITGRGGCCSMPTQAQVLECMKTVPKLVKPW